MKIQLQPYNPGWPVMFQQIRTDLSGHLAFLDPVIEHIGSTAVPGLAAKPIIDILVGIKEESALDSTVQPLVDHGYIFYDHEKYNASMPYRRFFVRLKEEPADLSVPPVYRQENDNELNERKLAHIQVLSYLSEHWTRHIAFRDYLIRHPEVSRQYGDLKSRLSLQEWKDGNDYNAAKNGFIKEVEARAVSWYREQKDTGTGNTATGL